MVSSDGCSQGNGCQDDDGCRSCSVERLCPTSRSSSAVEAPVCGSDGRTYAGHCAAKVAGCLAGVSLHVVHDGPCDELSGSGANDELATGSHVPSVSFCHHPSLSSCRHSRL